MDYRKILGRYNGEWTNPTYEGLFNNEIPDTALLGNGDVGIASGGNGREKTFYLSKGDFWVYGTTGQVWEPGMLPLGGITLREAEMDGTVSAGAVPAEKAVSAERTVLASGVVQEFYEKQDILNAQIETRQRLGRIPAELTTWLACDKNLIVTELVNVGDRKAELMAELWAASEENGAFRPVTTEILAESVLITRTTEKRAGYEQDPRAWISRAAAAVKVLGAETVRAARTGEGKGSVFFSVKPGQKIHIVTAVGGGGRTYRYDGSRWDGPEPEENALRLLWEMPDLAAVARLKREHDRWWGNFWQASVVDLGTEDEKLNQLQKFYYGAQYLLACSSREGKTAPGICGVWRVNDTPGWHGDYHMNYNYISPFYGVYASNHPELALSAMEGALSYVPEGERRGASVEELKKVEPYPGFIEEKIASGAVNRERGIPEALLFPVGIGPWCSTPDDTYLKELLLAGYNGYLFTQYYQYTLDECVVRPAYEFLKKCAALYEAWLTREDGTYRLYAGWCEGHIGVNPAAELATIQLVFQNLLFFSEKLGEDEDKYGRWREICEAMEQKPIWEVGGKRVFGLAEKRLDEKGGPCDFRFEDGFYTNVVMLEYLMPGDCLGYFSSPEELQIARDTIDCLPPEQVWEQMNNFPRIFTDAVRVRYPIEKVVERMYSAISGERMAANLRIVDHYHGIEKSGATEAVNSMLLASHKGIVKLFPNWFADKDARFWNLRAKGAFLISAGYDGERREAVDVVIVSEKGQPLTLVLPWSEGAHVTDGSGNGISYTLGTVPGWEEERTMTFETCAGETYQIQKGTA